MHINVLKINKNKITYMTAHKWETAVEPELGIYAIFEKNQILCKFFNAFRLRLLLSVSG